MISTRSLGTLSASTFVFEEAQIPRLGKSREDYVNQILEVAMSGPFSRRGLLGGLLGGLVALLKGVPAFAGNSAVALGADSPKVSESTTYVYDPRTGELVSSTTYDAQGRVIRQDQYGGDTTTYTYCTPL